MATGSSPSPSSAVEAVPLSAVAIAEPPAPEPELAPTWLDRLLQRIQPVAAYGMLFLMGLSGGLGVATAATLTIRYFAHGPDKQLAAVRMTLPRQIPEPLDVEIQKAKAELDAAVAPHGS